MAQFDLPNATMPQLAPLEASFSQNVVEKELKDLFIEVFKAQLGEDFYDLNVSGAAHLGSNEIVRRKINADGLTLLQGGSDVETANRYLYRAWNARDNLQRGMHFLRTYLQLIFPNLCSVEQMWQENDQPYPHALHTSVDPYVKPDPKTMWLTSRVEIALDLTIETRSITTLTSIIRSIVPARLVPQFLFWLIFDFEVHYEVATFLEMYKHSEVRHQLGVRLVTDREGAVWNLGKNSDLINAPKLGFGGVIYTGFYDLGVATAELDASADVSILAPLILSKREGYRWNLGRNDSPEDAYGLGAWREIAV